jgi:hypothetical protein
MLIETYTIIDDFWDESDYFQNIRDQGRMFLYICEEGVPPGIGFMRIL